MQCSKKNTDAAQLKKIIGQKIKFFRKKKGLSQDKLAEIVNIEMKSLSRIESGHNYPQCENLVAIASALSVAPWQFYFSDETKDINKMRDELIFQLNHNNNIIPVLYQYIKLQETNKSN